MADGEAPRFVSEKALEEAREKRQAEWEKARQTRPNLPNPNEAEPVKSLYDQLKLQKDKKEEETADAKRFKNQIRGIDTEEAEYLDLVSKRQMVADKERANEEKRLIAELRNAATSSAQPLPSTTGAGDKAAAPSKPQAPSKPTLTSLVRQGVKRKSTSEHAPTTAPKATSATADEPEKKAGSEVQTGRFESRVVAILPSYTWPIAADEGDSDDSDDSSSSVSSDCSVGHSHVAHDDCRSSGARSIDMAPLRPSIPIALLRRLRQEAKGGSGGCE